MDFRRCQVLTLINSHKSDRIAIYSPLCDLAALARSHFVASLKICFCLYRLLLFKMRIADDIALLWLVKNSPCEAITHRTTV